MLNMYIVSRRVIRKVTNYLGVLIALPVVLGIRCLSPFINIRFGYFFVDRIGHFAFDLEYYLCKKKEEVDEKQSIDLFFTKGNSCNDTLTSILNRQLFVDPLVYYLYEVERIMFGGRNNLLPARITTGSMDPGGAFAKNCQGITFLEEEEDLGKEYLRKIGCDNAKFVCLVVRDSAYLDTTQSARSWNYHDYRDTRIDNYLETVKFLANKGYWVFRMGKYVNQGLNIDHPHVVDYALSPDRSDFLDIWLLSKCSFCISTSTGLDSVADAFRRPIAFVNFLPLSWFQTWSNCVLAPAHLLWIETDKKLNCIEYLQHSYMRTEDYLEAGIRVKELSSDEILSVVTELEASLENAWSSTNKIERQQRQFWTLFKYGLNPVFIETENRKLSKQNTAINQRRPTVGVNRFYHPQARISTAFLQDNMTFLGKNIS